MDGFEHQTPGQLVNRHWIIGQRASKRLSLIECAGVQRLEDIEQANEDPKRIKKHKRGNRII